MNTKKLNKSYKIISILGKAYKVNFKYSNISDIELNQNNTDIELVLPKKYKNVDNTNIINITIEKLYTKIANTKIESIMEMARYILGFSPEDYIITKLEDTFYKCTKDKVLIISPDIFQYNKDIISTTILQAFCKIKYNTNSKIYKKSLHEAIQKYEIFKESLKINNEILMVG